MCVICIYIYIIINIIYIYIKCMFHSTHTHATPGLCRRTLQCGWFPFALSLFYSTYSKRGGVTKIFSLSDPHPDKCFDMVSDIPSGSIFGIYILYSGIIYSDILSDILSGFLSFFLTFHVAFYLAFILAFYLASILTFYLAFILTFYLASFQPFILASIWNSILALYLASFLTFSLTRALPGLRLGIRGWGPAVPAEIWRSRLRSVLRSGSAHLCLCPALLFICPYCRKFDF